MAQVTYSHKADTDTRLRVIDPACGSGRMLLAGSRVMGPFHEYYGIDLDHTCVKMAAINLFLNGVFHGEVMCADALRPDHFIASYRLSMFPFGVFRISDKEQSPLWHMHRDSFAERGPMAPNTNTIGKPSGSQLSFF